MKTYDIMVIGAGTSGLMAAIAAASSGCHVALIEKNKRVGKKLLLTGGGRCNVTNNRSVDEVIAHIPGNGKFLYSAFSQFNNFDIIHFFENNHVLLKEEDHGRMFPTTNKSATIVEALINKIKALPITLYSNTKVEKILSKNQKISQVVTDKESFLTSAVILATGGRTYPSTGATGDGYRLAKNLGHTITPLYATESPIVLADSYIAEKKLQGLSLRNVRLAVYNKKKKEIVAHQMDLIFTHFGIYGPAALRCSSFVNQELRKNNGETVSLAIDLFPDLTNQELEKNIQTSLKENSDKQLQNALNYLLPERLLSLCLRHQKLQTVKTKQLTSQQLQTLVSLLKHFPLHAIKTLPIEKSFVTGGGVSLKEVQPKTMESKLVQGLFFAGELLDINGYTGGYNITAAFVTGHVAGTHAAKLIQNSD